MFLYSLFLIHFYVTEISSYWIIQLQFITFRIHFHFLILGHLIYKQLKRLVLTVVQFIYYGYKSCFLFGNLNNFKTFSLLYLGIFVFKLLQLVLCYRTPTTILIFNFTTKSCEKPFQSTNLLQTFGIFLVHSLTTVNTARFLSVFPNFIVTQGHTIKI